MRLLTEPSLTAAGGRRREGEDTQQKGELRAKNLRSKATILQGGGLALRLSPNEQTIE
jgi:hypothetical protein